MSLYGIVSGVLTPRAEALSMTSTRGWDPVFASWGVISSATGERVSPQTATALSAYYACIIVVSSDCAKIPLKVFHKLAGGGREADPSHPASDLLMMEANDETSSINFREDLVASYLDWGHGYAFVARDRNGEPVELKVLHPPSVRPKHDESGKYYEVSLVGGGKEIVRPENMIHLRGPQGWSVAQKAVQSLGIALAEQKYTGTFLGQASAPSGIIKTAGEIKEPARARFEREWKKKYGGPVNAGTVAVLMNGADYQQLSVNPTDAQLLQSRQFSIEEVCRWFRISPHKVMDRARAQGWSTHEITQIEHVSDGLLPHMARLESALGLKVLTSTERQDGYYIRHVVQGLMRGDAKTRAAWYSINRRLGTLNANEIRSLEEMNPIGPSGDTYFIAGNMVPLDMAVTGELARGRAESADRGGPGGDANDDPNADTRNARALLPVFEDAARRVLRKETKALSRMAKKHESDPQEFVGAAADFFAGFASEVGEAFAAAGSALVNAAGQADLADNVGLLAGALSLFGHAHAEAALEYWRTAYDAGEPAPVHIEEHAGTLARSAIAYLSSLTILNGDDHG